MPSTTTIKVVTTRIAHSVIPVACVRETFNVILQRPCACCASMMTSAAGTDRSGKLRQVSTDEFAHAHHAEQDRKHDPADENRETEDHRGLEDRQKALDGDLHFAVVDVGDADQRLLETTTLFSDENHLRRE